jgi:hypothetical protein
MHPTMGYQVMLIMFLNGTMTDPEERDAALLLIQWYNKNLHNLKNLSLSVRRN